MTRAEVRRKRSARGRSQTCRILQQPYKYLLKCTRTRSLCEYWRPPECQFYKTEFGCKAGDKCLFPHHKVEEQPCLKPKKSFQNEKNDKGAVAFANTVPQIGLCPARLRAVRTSENILKDKSDAPAARYGILPNMFTCLEEKDKATFYSPTDKWIMPAASRLRLQKSRRKESL